MTRSRSTLFARALPALALGCLASVAFAPTVLAQDGPQSRPTTPTRPKAPTRALRWTLPKGWTAKTPSSRMRAMEAEIPGGLRVVIYHFGKGRGGTPQANLDRWLGQIKPEGGRAAKDVARRSLRVQNRLVIRSLDVNGTYVAETAPGSGKFVNKPGQRLMAAVVEGGDGPYFVKLIGVAKAVEAQVKSFYKFLGSLDTGSRQGLVLSPPAGWTAAPPTNRMRWAELKLGDDLSLVVYFFGEGSGGGVEANFTRWLGQINGPEGGPVEGKRGKLSANGLVIHTLDASGTYLSGMPGRPKVAREGYRLLGAVVVGAGGPYFMKLVGPKAAVAKQEKAYQAFLRQGLAAIK